MLIYNFTIFTWDENILSFFSLSPDDMYFDVELKTALLIEDMQGKKTISWAINEEQ